MLASTPRCAGESNVPRVEHSGAGLHVAPRGPYVLGRFRLLDDDVIAVDACALDHHDRVGAVGHRRAGHDANRLAGPDCDRRRPARGQLTDHTQATRRVGRAHRVPVHARVREGRHLLGRRRRPARARVPARPVPR